MKTLILFSVFMLISFFRGVDCTVEQVHVVFRHGDRTPDPISYPTDPHADEDFYPIGKGQLTTLGKQQEYKLGQNLRKTYNKFLGKIFTDGILEARSTDTVRTKMSLQLVLAGLWPPAPLQKWHTALNWQPITYIYDPIDTDRIMTNVIVNKELNEKFDELLQTKEVQFKMENYKWLYEVVSEHGGFNATKPVHLVIVYFALYTQQQMGLILPEWTNTIFPDALEKAVIFYYELNNYNSEIQKITIGGLFSKIKTDIINKIQGTSNTKLYLYSGHEVTVASTLIGLDVFQYNPHIPSYGSYVTMELHKINNEYGIQLFYNDYNTDIPLPIVMPECEIFCPIEKFFSLIGHMTNN